ncbi:hypothetical protein ACS0TY_024598 [Phlomoides rotata]
MPCFNITELIDNKWSACKKSDWYQLKRVLDEQKRSTRGQAGFLGMIRLRDETCEMLVDYRSDYFYQEGRLQFEFKDAHPFMETYASV